MPDEKREKVEKWKLTPEMTEWYKSYKMFLKMQKQLTAPLMYHAQQASRLKDALQQLQTGKSEMLKRVPQISKELDKQPEFDADQMELTQ